MTDPDFAAMRQRCENYENMTALEGDDVQPEDESLLRQMRHEAVRDLPIALARIEQQEREIAELRDSLTYLFFNEAVFHNALRYCLVKGEDIPDNKPLLKAAELVRANIKLLPKRPTAPQTGEASN